MRGCTDGCSLWGGGSALAEQREAIAGVRRESTGRVVGVHGQDRSGALVAFDGRFVVGADGLTSRVARSVGAPMLENGRTAVRCSTRTTPGVRGRHRADRRRPRAGRGVPDPRRRSLRLGPRLRPTHTLAARLFGYLVEVFTAQLEQRLRPSSRPGCAAASGSRRSPACCGCPTTSGRPTGRAGRWSATPAITGTPSPGTE